VALVRNYTQLITLSYRGRDSRSRWPSLSWMGATQGRWCADVPWLPPNGSTGVVKGRRCCKLKSGIVGSGALGYDGEVNKQHRFCIESFYLTNGSSSRTTTRKMWVGSMLFVRRKVDKCRKMLLNVKKKMATRYSHLAIPHPWPFGGLPFTVLVELWVGTLRPPKPAVPACPTKETGNRRAVPAPKSLDAARVVPRFPV